MGQAQPADGQEEYGEEMNTIRTRRDHLLVWHDGRDGES